MPSSFVSAFYEDREQNLWIGTDGGGLSYWNRDKNTFTNYAHKPGQPGTLSHNSVPSFKEDYLGNTWIATFGGGINKFNKAKGNFERYPCLNMLTGLKNNYVWLLFEDRDRNLWACTYANGRLYQLNRQTDRFENFNQEAIDIFSMAEDHNGTLWAGTAFGLIKVDRQNKNFIRYIITKPVRAIHEDKKGRLWIGTEGLGLILFDREKGKPGESYTDAEGLSNNSVLNILEDGKGHLWLSTFNGLSEFNPEDKTFKNYFQDDGLQSNQFLYNAALRLTSGEMIFGGIKGFNLFHPDSIYSGNNKPPVMLTGLRINNEAVMEGSPYITKISGDKIETVRIPYDEAVLSFDFASLEYSTPRKIRYAYYLEGWDKGWSNPGLLRTANYTRLSEGNYMLRVKATTADGSWNPQEVRMKIVVLPPWYRTWWAYAIYILMAGGAIMLYQRYRIYQAKLKYEVNLANMKAEKQQAALEIERAEREKSLAELEKERAEKERQNAELALEKAEKERGRAELAVKWAELEKEKAERETERVKSEKEREINEKRNSFFTHISHEFRTPLTLIINPIKDLLQKRKENEMAPDGELPVVYRNARRLLSLVDELLLFRKAESGADRIRPVKINLGTVAKEPYLCFVQQARSKNIIYDLECGDSLEIYADPQKLEIILYNLLSNAVKYTGPGGRITLRITEREHHVLIEVEDTGVGIPEEVGDRLFEKFYQPDFYGAPAVPGFGIGLYLAKHFTEQHKGEILYRSEVGKGTTFTLHFLKGKEHFEPGTVFNEGAVSPIMLQELRDVNRLEEALNPEKELNPVHDVVSEKKSMLIVDDDEQTRNYLAQLFKDNYTTHLAETGEDGLKQAQKYLPDLIISDVNMAGLNGIELCRIIKENASLSHIPVILLSSSASDEARLRGAESGADDYIVKPFDKNLLLARITTILKSRTKLQNYFYNEVTLQKNNLKISAEYKEFLDNCMSIVEAHLDDPDFNINMLVTELRTSRSNLYKKVKSISGLSTSAFVRFIRLRKAAELFIHTRNNINETATQVGFNDMKYFREQFFKLFGMKPSEYIKKYRKAFGKSFNLNEDEFRRES
jgi:signal transduction histidine kinase/DNA-binding response OmpR family regulator